MRGTDWLFGFVVVALVLAATSPLVIHGCQAKLDDVEDEDVLGADAKKNVMKLMKANGYSDIRISFFKKGIVCNDGLNFDFWVTYMGRLKDRYGNEQIVKGDMCCTQSGLECEKDDEVLVDEDSIMVMPTEKIP